MPNPDFPSWLAVGVVLTEVGDHSNWLVVQIELQFPLGVERQDQEDFYRTHYAIHLAPVVHTQAVVLERRRLVTITLPALRRYRYTGLVMTPDGMRQDEDYIPDEEVLAAYTAAGSNEPSEESATLAGLPSYLQTPDRRGPGWLGLGDPAVQAVAASIRASEDQRILDELAVADERGPHFDPNTFTVIGPLRANNEGQPNPFRDHVLEWAARNQAGTVQPDDDFGEPQELLLDFQLDSDYRVDETLETGESDANIEPFVPRGETDQPIVQIGQDWVLGQPHAGVWRIFGYEGEPGRNRATQWALRNITTQAYIHAGGGWLVDHAVRQAPPDPRHRQNVSTLGSPSVVLGQVWQIPLGRRKRAPGRPVNFRVKEIKDDRVMLLSEEKNSGQRIYTTIAKLLGEGTLIGDGTPRRTAYERLLADHDVLDDD